MGFDAVLSSLKASCYILQISLKLLDSLFKNSDSSSVRGYLLLEVLDLLACNAAVGLGVLKGYVAATLQSPFLITMSNGLLSFCMSLHIIKTKKPFYLVEKL